jgi:hypothetical protein
MNEIVKGEFDLDACFNYNGRFASKDHSTHIHKDKEASGILTSMCSSEKPSATIDPPSFTQMYPKAKPAEPNQPLSFSQVKGGVKSAHMVGHSSPLAVKSRVFQSAVDSVKQEAPTKKLNDSVVKQEVPTELRKKFKREVEDDDDDLSVSLKKKSNSG